VHAGIWRTIVTALLGAALAGAAGAMDARPYDFAVVPQAPPEQTRALWLPVVERLTAVSGVPLRLQLYARVEDFQAALSDGSVELAFANPVQAIRAAQAAGYRPIIRNDRLLRGVFFVAADSPVASVDALQGREVAFVGPWTFCSVSLRSYARGLHIHPKYVGTSANAYKSVLLGMAAAGGVLDATLEDAPPGVRAKLRVVYETPPMAPHAVIAHPRVPPEVASRVASALRAMASEGAGLLGPVHLEAPVEASYARDYAPLEQLLDVVERGTGDGARP
jgi:phosphonate transport system substrate-binding protein